MYISESLRIQCPDMEGQALEAQSGAMILPILVAVLAAASNQPADFHFVTAEHEISMKVEFPEAYRGQPLAFFGGDAPASRRCLTDHCIDRFYGAVAVVNFRVTKAHPKAQKPSQLREVVTIVEQSADLPVTPRLDLTKKVVNGEIGDVQLLGYDEDGIPAAERDRMRREAPTRMWRKVRQELYLNGAAVPFAVVEWRHTMDSIRIETITGVKHR